MSLPFDQLYSILLPKTHIIFFDLLDVVDEGGPPHLIGYMPPFCVCQHGTYTVFILRPRPHKRLAVFFFVHRWLIIVVSSLAANSARTTCMVCIVSRASCFSLFFLCMCLYYSTLSNFPMPATTCASCKSSFFCMLVLNSNNYFH